MASKGMGRLTTVNYVFRFKSQAFVVNNATPCERIDLPSKLARGVATRLIFGAGCSSDHSVSCEMTLTALPVSTKIFERATPPTSNAITKSSSWGISSFTVLCSWKPPHMVAIQLKILIPVSQDFSFMWCILEIGDSGTVNRSSQGMGAFMEIIDLS
ncbi:hypothetical protein DY000_02006218 [Brassica cretica]|uniref:Uncharacterized protein n=1 Tax=Brassica cretica TaxID=69181 RepID=A0ABQ7CHC1_BRACR|nr:hypothetical protein DY000_02006218 [Brassica cretica]